MNSTVKQILFWVLIIACLLVLWQLFQKNGAMGGHEQEINFSQFLGDVENNQVSDVTITGPDVRGHFRADKGAFHVTVPANYPHLFDVLDQNKVSVTVKNADGNSWWGWLLQFSPLILIALLWFFMIRQMQSGGNKALSFGKSRARLLSMQQKKVTFKDVAGVDEAKEELKEIIEFLREAQKFQKLGGRIPKGVLLVGPPGTGKTLLARAVAGEANVPFFSISGSDFVEMFVGVGASRVRDLFEQGKKNAPCIIFIDEIDAVGRHRGAGLGGGHDEREQTLNQLLVEMDGFESNDGVILVAATNRPDVLDPALLRPGRFDRQVVVPNPDVVGREKILKVHMRKVPLASDVDPKIIARGTPGFSGADLANLVNEAALMAARRSKRSVAMSEFEQAKDKVMMGAERRSMVMTEDEKKLTAYHEAGHALCMLYAEGHEPLHKVTIIPRGRALGVTMFLPERDKYSQSKTEIKAMLASLFGGRVSEELIFGPEKVTTGAADDIKRATNLARRMVTEFGFSEKLGPLRYSDNEEEVFLGHSVTQRKNVSDATAKVIDDEIRRIVEEGEHTARGILTSHLDELHALAQGLLEYETLSSDEIRRVIKGERIIRDTSTGPAPTTDEPRPGAGRRSSVPPTGRTSGIGPAEPEPQPGG